MKRNQTRQRLLIGVVILALPAFAGSQDILARMEEVMGTFPQRANLPALDVQVSHVQEEDCFVRKTILFTAAENEFVPSTYVTIDDEENIVRMSRLLEMLDDNDDVQNVWHNWANEPESEA